MTLEQLKANAYDAISQIELWQRKLQEINKQISEWKPEPPITPEPPETSYSKP